MSKAGPSKQANGIEFSSVTAEFLENSGFLKRFLTRFFHDQQDIEDVAQETFLRAYVAEQSQSIQQPKAYLFRVAKNIALTRLTRKSRQITDYIADLAAPDVIYDETSAADEAEADESLGIYCEAVAALPEKCRQVFLLRKVHGLTHAEIAERMSLSISSVEKYLLKGILACQAFVQRRVRGTLTSASGMPEKQKARK